MTSRDRDDPTPRIETYMEDRFRRYIAWYEQNLGLARNNLIAAAVVVVVCVLLLVFFPGPMEQMSFLQIEFDPTLAIKLGLAAAIGLALVSVHTTYKRWQHGRGVRARLEDERARFEAGGEAAFDAFEARVEEIMAAADPELVAAIKRDNARRKETS